MVDRDRKFALGVAAAAAVGAAAGAAVVMRKRGPDDGHGAEARHPGEEGSGRGTPGEGPDAASLESGHDVKDARVGALVKVMVVSLALMVGSTAAVFYLYSRFDKANQAPNASLTAEQKAPIPPPLPHLQAEPYRDIDAATMQQTQRLTTYGWDSSDHKDAHIPIERAIQQVVGKSLDGSAQADAAGPKGSTAPQPSTPAVTAAEPQDKPANHVQGEGRPGAVAPSISEPGASEPKP